MGKIEDRDADYFWLRQTAEVALGDQRRTVEIAIPVRIGATHDEIARLLDEAESGMEQLGERMDRRVAALRSAAPTSTGSSARPATSVARPANGLAERPATASRPAPSPNVARPAGRSPTPSAAAPAAPAAGVMTRAEFLEQTRTLGLLPRQVMDRLAVRTLEGLNYTEALEQIRRQLLRESTQGAQENAPSPASAPSAPDAPAQVAAAQASATSEPAPASKPGTYFDEEDDYDVSFELPNDDEIDELDLDALDDSSGSAALVANPQAPEAAAPARPATRREPEPPDLDDVPDFAEPRGTRREPGVKSGAPAAAPATAQVAQSAAPTHSAPLTSHQALAQRARAHDLLARLHEYRGGTPAGSDQIGPFTNVVVDQLGEKTLATLTEQVWGIAPDQLTAQQMRALIQWGKTDPFSTEVDAVLDLLAADRPADAAGEAKAPSRAAKSGARPAGRVTGSTR